MSKSKNYTIYTSYFPQCPDKSPKDVIEKARALALTASLKEFKKQIKDNKDIKLAKEQPEDAVAINIDEKALDQVLTELVAMDIVMTIDAGYSGPPIIETAPPPTKDIKRFLK